MDSDEIWDTVGRLVIEPDAHFEKRTVKRDLVGTTIVFQRVLSVLACFIFQIFVQGS